MTQKKKTQEECKQVLTHLSKLMIKIKVLFQIEEAADLAQTYSTEITEFLEDFETLNAQFMDSKITDDKWTILFTEIDRYFSNLFALI